MRRKFTERPQGASAPHGYGRGTWVWRRRLAAIAAVAVVGTGLFVGPGGALVSLVNRTLVSSSSSTPQLATGRWTCSAASYLEVVGGQFETAYSISHWTKVGPSGDPLNALAFVPASHNVVAIDAKAGPNVGDLVSVAPSGKRTVVGPVSGLSRTTSWLGGDVDPSTGLFYVSHGGHQLSVINLSTLKATPVTLPVGFTMGDDLIVQHDWIWTVNSATIDGFSLVSGLTKSFPIPSADLGNAAGTMWTTATQDHFYFRWNNTGATYNVTGLRTNNISLVKVATLKIPASANQDGSTCMSTQPITPDNAPSLVVSGNLSTPLAPGASTYVNLVLTNTYATPVILKSHDLRVDLSDNSPSCSVVTNFWVRHGTIVDVTVPANTTTTLSALGIPMVDWPKIQMLNLPINQDDCQGVTLSLTYTTRYHG